VEERSTLNSNEFLAEQIKKRPVNKWKVIRKILEVAMLAVLFGVVSSVTMLTVAPILEKRLFPAPAPEVNEVVFMEESAAYTSEEVMPEDMLLEEEKIVNGTTEHVDREQQMLEFAEILQQKAESCKSWLVKVSGAFSETSWLASTRTKANVAMGAIIADNGAEILILVEQKGMATADSITVTFPDGAVLPATIKGKDEVSGLMVIAVNKEGMGVNTLQSFQIAELASSNNKAILGSIVLALGSPNGVLESVGYGIVTTMGMEINNWDINYKMMMTDMYGSTNQEGFLVNMKGEILGIICDDYNTTDIRSVISAIGISELKGTIQLMSNAEAIPSLGIMGTDVTRQANKEHGIPYGAYVTDVKINEPAMKAGIQAGDVIVSLNKKDLLSMNMFCNYLQQLEAGNTIQMIIKRQSMGEYKEIELELTLGSK